MKGRTKEQVHHKHKHGAYLKQGLHVYAAEKEAFTLQQQAPLPIKHTLYVALNPLSELRGTGPRLTGNQTSHCRAMNADVCEVSHKYRRPIPH